MPLLNSAKDFLLDLIFPIRCINCGEFSTAYVCDDCMYKIAWNTSHYCLFCGTPCSYKNICLKCAGKRNCFLDACLSPTSYKDSLPRSMVSCLKYKFVKDVAPLMAGITAKYIDHQIKQGLLDFNLNTVVIPVPLSPSRYRWRGFNQTDILAQQFAFHFSLPMESALIRTSFKKPQVELTGKADRAKNVKEAFACNSSESVRGKSIILIDDVATTGATLNECAKVLKENGAKEVIGLVFSRG